MLNLNCKHKIKINRDSENIQIGCIEKTITEWDRFFKNKEKIELDPDSIQYSQIEIAYKSSKIMREWFCINGGES